MFMFEGGWRAAASLASGRHGVGAEWSWI